VATRGVVTVGKGICCKFDMSVIVLGVRDVIGVLEGDGGKTKRV
jgi:hypothetical protein